MGMIKLILKKLNIPVHNFKQRHRTATNNGVTQYNNGRTQYYINCIRFETIKNRNTVLLLLDPMHQVVLIN
jgi:hypothetical protein